MKKGRRYIPRREAVRKLLLVPLHALFYPIARLVPRDEKLWVFGCKVGFGDGPLHVLRAVRELRPDLRLVWLAQTDEDCEKARSEGVECVRVDSLRGAWICLRAKRGFITHGFGDLNRYTCWGMDITLLWHGVPLKRILLDSPSLVENEKSICERILRWIYNTLFRLVYGMHVARMISPSELATSRYRSAFGFPANRILQLGDARCAPLCLPENERIQAARKKLEALLGYDLPQRIVMYAPTWRDGKEVTLLSVDDLYRADELMRQLNAILLLRAHHFLDLVDETFQLDQLTNVKLLGPSLCPDVNSILAAVDVLITDYSSIAADYSLLRRPLLFYAPDLGVYEKKPGFYEPYEQFTNGVWASSWAEVLDMTRRVFEDSDWREELIITVSDSLRLRYHTYTDALSRYRVAALLTGTSHVN